MHNDLYDLRIGTKETSQHLKRETWGTFCTMLRYRLWIN